MKMILIAAGLAWFYAMGMEAERAPAPQVEIPETRAPQSLKPVSDQSHPCPYVRHFQEQSTQASSVTNHPCPYIRSVHQHQKVFNQAVHRAPSHKCPYLEGEKVQRTKKKDTTFWI